MFAYFVIRNCFYVIQYSCILYICTLNIGTLFGLEMNTCGTLPRLYITVG